MSRRRKWGESVFFCMLKGSNLRWFVVMFNCVETTGQEDIWEHLEITWRTEREGDIWDTGWMDGWMDMWTHSQRSEMCSSLVVQWVSSRFSSRFLCCFSGLESHSRAGQTGFCSGCWDAADWIISHLSLYHFPAQSLCLHALMWSRVTSCSSNAPMLTCSSVVMT